MNSARLQQLLEDVRRNQVSVKQALDRLRDLPFEDLGFAKVDHHRVLRRGFPEVILGQGKQIREIAAIIKAMQRRNENILVTRVGPEKVLRLKKLAPGLTYHAAANAITWTAEPPRTSGKGTILIVCAGTSDIPVAG
jgi:NCAIR mutase (PurE)-related protein